MWNRDEGLKGHRKMIEKKFKSESKDISIKVYMDGEGQRVCEGHLPV